jgi:cytidylate kinase
MDAAPVIAIDGPSASGKGTIAQKVAAQLGFHYLDSGALYRLVALAAQRAGVALDDHERLGQIARSLPARFHGSEIFLDGDNVTDAIRAEAVSAQASVVAALPAVRAGLLDRQRGFRRPPGLVADGRDMGSVVFPDARLKIFLTAGAQERANRRYKQLMEKGLHANMAALLQDIQQRDARDSSRSVAPLHKAADARVVDTTALSIEETVSAVIAAYREVCEAP